MRNRSQSERTNQAVRGKFHRNAADGAGERYERQQYPSSTDVHTSTPPNPPRVADRPWFCVKCDVMNERLEVEVGIEPTYSAFAEPCLTTWRSHRFRYTIKLVVILKRSRDFLKKEGCSAGGKAVVRWGHLTPRCGLKLHLDVLVHRLRAGVGHDMAIRVGEVPFVAMPKLQTSLVRKIEGITLALSEHDV